MPEGKFTGLKFIFLALVVGALVCLAMCGVTLRRMIAHVGQAPQAHVASTIPFHRTAQQDPANARLKLYAGKWLGNSMVPKLGACNLSFEMRELPEAPGRFAGFATITCVPLKPFVTGGKYNALSVILQRTPRSAILSGVPDNGSLSFHVDKLIGAESCPMSGFSASPFGTTQLAVEWKNGACPAGQMVLTRAGQ